MNIANEDKKINAIVEQWVNLLFAQIRRDEKTKKDKHKNKKNG